MRRRARAGAVAGLVATAAVLAGCDAFRSFEAVCEKRLPPTVLDVVVEPVSYRVDRSLDYAALTRRGAAIAGADRQVLGLTEANLGYGITVSARGMKSRTSGRYCVRPSVEVTVGFNPMTVYMGADVPEGSCVDRLTREHELKHVAVYQEYLPIFAEDARAALREAFGERVQFFDTPEAAQRRMDETATRLLKPLLDRSMAEVRAKQRLVDSAAEYARIDRVRAACGGGTSGGN